MRPPFQYYSAVRAYFEQQEAAGPSDGDTVYLYTASNLAGMEQTVPLWPGDSVCTVRPSEHNIEGPVGFPTGPLCLSAAQLQQQKLLVSS